MGLIKRERWGGVSVGPGQENEGGRRERLWEEVERGVQRLQEDVTSGKGLGFLVSMEERWHLGLPLEAHVADPTPCSSSCLDVYANVTRCTVEWNWYLILRLVSSSTPDYFFHSFPPRFPTPTTKPIAPFFQYNSISRHHWVQRNVSQFLCSPSPKCMILRTAELLLEDGAGAALAIWDNILPFSVFLSVENQVLWVLT